ncbi:hypothetical protein P8452_58802 [Trifolium repens]|nr:hypothetical protein P8452_58802 [Trifolium repens]
MVLKMHFGGDSLNHVPTGLLKFLRMFYATVNIVLHMPLTVKSDEECLSSGQQLHDTSMTFISMAASARVSMLKKRLVSEQIKSFKMA